MTLTHADYQTAVHELMSHGYRPHLDDELETWIHEPDGSEYLIGRIDGTDHIELVKLL